MNRSFLFAPGNHARRVAKAFTLGADAVILDLEDSVAVAEKEAARKPVAAALASSPGRGCRAYVRVNAMGTPFCFRDLTEVIGKGVDGIVLPKVESAADLHAIDWLLANLERERGLAVGAIDLIPAIETAAGMARIEPPLDSPWFKLKDLAGLRASSAASRRMGFQGRMCIHPEQIAPVNESYAPSADEVARAERIVAAFREAEAKGSAAIQVDGQMIDYQIVREAERVLKSAAAPSGAVTKAE